MKDPKKNSIPTMFPDMLKAYEFRSPVTIMNKLIVMSSVHQSRFEHVSVHGITSQGIEYTPSWDEMCFIKDQFFEDEQVVIQIHPKKSQYVNHHQHCLHLWRDLKETFNLPV